ncbi:MAG: DUF4349 domain-containing protein [Anaerolineae bacterium]|nr:DUF4349 domain-containing protein [Anaerolineae bacterium]
MSKFPIKREGHRTTILIATLIVLVVMLGACAPAAAPFAEEVSSRGYGGAAPMPEAPAAEMAAPMEEYAADAAMAPSGSVTNVSAEGALQTERLIIRTGDVSLYVEDTRATQQRIEDLVNQYAGDGAFVVSSSEYGGGADSQPSISISIRVPAERFDATMDGIAGMAVEVISRTESGQDVTEEYVDLGARLESLEAARDRLLEIMASAQNTEDLLAAEAQLTAREEEIESIKGRMKFLSESAALSSISVSLQPYILYEPVDEGWKPAVTFRRAVESLIDGAKGFADFLIVFVIAVLPWLLLFGLVIYGIVRFIAWRVRAGKEKRAARAAVQNAAQGTGEKTES